MANPAENTDQTATPIEATSTSTELPLSLRYAEEDCDRAIDQLVAAMDPENPHYETIPQALIASIPAYVWTEIYYVPLHRYSKPIARELGKLIVYLQETEKITIRNDGPYSDPDWIETNIQSSVHNGVDNVL